MLTQLQYTVSPELMQEAVRLIPEGGLKLPINYPTGNFFYDPWVIKPELQDTVWDKILQTLPFAIGEARLITLDPATCYHIHADIDDRYHLNLLGEHCYLIDFEKNKLHKIEHDGNWHYMNAGKIHSAVNFGRLFRVQLVVRKLLNSAEIQNSVAVKFTIGNMAADDARFVFDNSISPWLNQANKNNLINNFDYSNGIVTFNTSADQINELTNIVDPQWTLEIT